MNIQIEKLAKQYEPLVNKITSQMTIKCSKYPWNDIKSMAYEGLSVAIHTYDETKSKMTFTQFAAFCIRNYILIGINNEMHTVKYPAYARKNFEPNISISSIDAPVNTEHSSNVEMYFNTYYEEKFDVNVIDYLISKLCKIFCEKDTKIFCLYFGLNGEEIKGKDIAAKLGVSTAYISQKIKMMITAIKKDDELFEMLSDYYNL